MGLFDPRMVCPSVHSASDPECRPRTYDPAVGRPRTGTPLWRPGAGRPDYDAAPCGVQVVSRLKFPSICEVGRPSNLQYGDVFLKLTTYLHGGFVSPCIDHIGETQIRYTALQHRKTDVPLLAGGGRGCDAISSDQ
jgi:hypothetical protein